MKVSAVGFLFQNKIKSNDWRGYNYTCVIHKVNKEGNFNRNLISSPLVKESRNDIVSPQTAKEDVINHLNSITAGRKGTKFVGATVKDGVKETEIHSIFSDKLFAIRTRDDLGKNHFSIRGQKGTQKTLAKNLYLQA